VRTPRLPLAVGARRARQGAVARWQLRLALTLTITLALSVTPNARPAAGRTYAQRADGLHRVLWAEQAQQEGHDCVDGLVGRHAHAGLEGLCTRAQALRLPPAGGCPGGWRDQQGSGVAMANCWFVIHVVNHVLSAR